MILSHRSSSVRMAPEQGPGVIPLWSFVSISPGLITQHSKYSKRFQLISNLCGAAFFFFFFGRWGEARTKVDILIALPIWYGTYFISRPAQMQMSFTSRMHGKEIFDCSISLSWRGRFFDLLEGFFMLFIKRSFHYIYSYVSDFTAYANLC